MSTQSHVAASLARKLQTFGQTLTPDESEAFVELLQGLQADVSGHLTTTTLFSLTVSSSTSTVGGVSSSTVSELTTALGGDPAHCRLWLTLPDGQRICILAGD